MVNVPNTMRLHGMTRSIICTRPCALATLLSPIRCDELVLSRTVVSNVCSSRTEGGSADAR